MDKKALLFCFVTLVLPLASSAKILDPKAPADRFIDPLEQPLDKNGIDIRQNWRSGIKPASSARPQLGPLEGYYASGALQVPPIKGTSFTEILTTNPQQPIFETVLLGAKEEQIVHTITDGDTLPSIAKKYSGDESNWRLIAEANKIGDTQTLEVGQKLALPGFPHTHADKLRVIWNKADETDRVFISFARADTAHARVVESVLNARGYATFLYLQDALAQPTFSVDEFAQFFKSAGKRYVLDTPNSRTSPAVALEAKLAESLTPRPNPPIAGKTTKPKTEMKGTTTGNCTCRYMKGTPPPTSCADPRCGPVIHDSAIPNWR